jgi:hypothetical protein
MITLILCSGRGFSQKGVLDNSAIREEFPRQSILKIKDGRTVRGFYIGVRGDTLVFLHKGEEVGFPFENLQEVRIVGGRGDAMPTVLPSVILGGYAAATLIAGGQSALFGYLDPYDGVVGPLVLGIGAGLAVGYLASVFLTSSSAPTEQFLFGGEAGQDQRTIEEFRLFVNTGRKTPRFHLTVHGGSISTRSGSVPREEPYYSHPYSSEGSTNLARRIQFSYSITPAIDVGIALVRLTEPPLMLWRSFGTSVSSVNGSHNESLTGTAFLAVGGVQPLIQILPEELGWTIDLGIGYAPVTFASRTNTNTTVYTNYPNWSEPTTTIVEDRTTFDGPRLGLMLATTFDVYLYDHFSIGLSGEYTLAAGSSLPAVPEWDVPARWCGSSCFGINLGLHF